MLLDFESILKQIVEFKVDHDLFKGHLLAPFQIEETALKRELVMKVEQIFIKWMRQIKMILVIGNQIRRDRDDAGPLNELEYWRQNLASFTSASEFVATKVFKNHLECLSLSRSKLVAVNRCIFRFTFSNFNFANIRVIRFACSNGIV